MDFFELFSKVLDHFDGDIEKTCTWFETPNNNFGGCNPLLLMTMGRARKVRLFIESSLYLNGE